MPKLLPPPVELRLDNGYPRLDCESDENGNVNINLINPSYILPTYYCPINVIDVQISLQKVKKEFRKTIRSITDTSQEFHEYYVHYLRGTLETIKDYFHEAINEHFYQLIKNATHWTLLDKFYPWDPLASPQGIKFINVKMSSQIRGLSLYLVEKNVQCHSCKQRTANLRAGALHSSEDSMNLFSLQENEMIFQQTCSCTSSTPTIFVVSHDNLIPADQFRK